MLVRSECTWVQSRNGTVPAGAFPIGQTTSGEILYAARVHVRGGISLGKVNYLFATEYVLYLIIRNWYLFYLLYMLY